MGSTIAKNYWIATVIVALVAVSIFGAYVAIAFGTSQTASQPLPVSLSSLNKKATSTNTDTGLQLQLSIDSIQLKRGQSIGATVTLYNPLETDNNVSASHSWPINGLSISPCGTMNEPIGLALFQGYYTTRNISEATPLSLYSPGAYNCPSILSPGYYLFQPMSDSAIIGSDPSLQAPSPITASLGANGTWTGSGAGVQHQLFPPGIYTVAAGDEWGDVVILYFVVGTP